MLKRISALCLILTLALSLCFALPVSAANPSERQLIYDLGIVAEPSDYGLIPKSFNRASFAEALTAMTKTKLSEEVTEENAAKYATDIAVHASAGSIMNVLAMGYMQVDEAGKFNPNQPITKQDAITSFVKVLGYDPVVKANGGEAGDYLLQASKLGVLKGVTIADESKLTAEEVAKMVANAMGVPFISYEGIIGSPSCLWELWELSVGTGVVEANSNMGIGISKVAANRMRINGTTLYSRVEVPNELVGAKVTYYTVPGERGNEVVSIFASGSEENVTLTGDDIESITDRGRYIEIVDINEDKIMVDKQGYLMINGKVQTPTKALLSMLDSGEATFVDTDDDGCYDVIHMTLLYQVVVEGISADTMALRTGFDKQVISFQKADVVEVYMGKKVADFSQIKAGMVIGIACDAFTITAGTITWDISNAEYVRLYVSNRSEVGMIDGIEGTDTFSINDVKKEYGSGYKRLTNGGYLPPLKLGYYVEAFYDNYGKLAYYKVVGGSEALNYGYLIAGGVEPGALERTTKLKILDANSRFTEYATSKKFILDGAIVDTGSTLYNVNGIGDVDLTKRQVIRFRVFDGVIREIDTKVVRATAEDTANTLDEVLASGTQTIRSGAISRRFVFASDSIMFVDEAASDALNPPEKMFRVGKATDLSDDDYTLACYDANDDMEIACVVRKIGSGSSTSTKGLGANNYCYVVEKVARSVDEEGNPVWILSLAGNGTRGDYLVPSETLKLYCITDITGPMEGTSTNEYPPIVLKDTSTFESVIKTGDVVRILTNTAGNVTRVEKLFDFATHKDSYIDAQSKTGQSSAFVRVDKVKGSNFIYDNGTVGATKYVTERTTHYSNTVLYHVKTGEAELLPFSSIPSAATGNTVKAWMRFYNKGQNRDNIFYIYD